MQPLRFFRKLIFGGTRMETARMESFEDLDVKRCNLAMNEETAEQIAMRVKLHLWRGSIEQARDALEAGWESHVGESAPLPRGTELLDVPLARVMTFAGKDSRSEIRLLNTLKEAGICTVRDLLCTSQAELLTIPNLGHVALLKLTDLGRKMAQLITAPEIVQVPTS